MNWVAILKLRTLMTIILPLSNWPFGLFVLVAILKLRTLVTIILPPSNWPFGQRFYFFCKAY
jgi:hypothetical protein